MTDKDDQILAEKIFTSREAADYLRVTKTTLCIWRTDRRYNLPYIKYANKILYKKTDLDAFIAKHSTSAEQEAER